MNKAISRSNRAVWPALASRGAQKLAVSGQMLAALLNGLQRCLQAGRDGCGREFNTNNAGCFQGLLIFSAKTISLIFDKLLKLCGI